MLCVRSIGKKAARGRQKHVVSVSPFTFITVAALTLLGYGITLLSYTAVLFMHEFAHAFVAERLGYTLKSVRILPYGVAISGDFDCLRPSHEVAIALAGPLLNLIVWIALAGLWWQFPETYAATQLIAEASFFTAAVNLMPVYPLDGGRALHGALGAAMPPEKAEKILKKISYAVGAVMVCGCVALIVTGANFTFATLGIFIVASLVLPGGRNGYERIHSMANTEKRLKLGLRVREIMVDENATLLSMYKMLRSDRYTRFLIADKNMKISAIVTETELDALISRFNVSEKAISLAKLT